jgi:lambda repressor-like predicted transcriptional regulator
MQNVRIYMEVKSAYEQCDPEIRSAIDDLVAIYNDCEATDDEKHRASFTIAEAIFPGLGADLVELERCKRRTPEAQARAAEMAEQEAYFAERVAALMSAQGMTQEALGEKIGVGQSAISNMLNRRCRPQTKTVGRIAEALGVRPEELWPLPK